jgi:hypothetical protein
VTFLSTANVHSLDCIGNALFGTGNANPCPAAVTTDTYSGEIAFLEGPVPSNGGTVTGLEATTNTAVSGTGTWTVDIVDNTSGSVLLSCQINTTPGTLGDISTTACKNTGSASVTAGHYIEARATKGGSPLPADKPFRVTVRY